jgi:hypothetical protein
MKLFFPEIPGLQKEVELHCNDSNDGNCTQQYNGTNLIMPHKGMSDMSVGKNRHISKDSPCFYISLTQFYNPLLEFYVSTIRFRFGSLIFAASIPIKNY